MRKESVIDLLNELEVEVIDAMDAMLRAIERPIRKTYSTRTQTFLGNCRRWAKEFSEYHDNLNGVLLGYIPLIRVCLKKLIEVANWIVRSEDYDVDLIKEFLHRLCELYIQIYNEREHLAYVKSERLEVE